MKTTRSAFCGFPRDRYTTLANRRPADGHENDRHLAVWRPDIDLMLPGRRPGRPSSVFADYDSPSVRLHLSHGQRHAERHEELDEVRMVLPNLHHWTADLGRFGLDERPTGLHRHDQPHGLIEATVRRSDVS